MLTNHRRGFWWSALLLASCLAALFLVGRHHPTVAPDTSWPVVGEVDQTVSDWVGEIRVAPLTWLFRFLNVLGGGIVTIPLRIVAAAVLAHRRRWRAFGAFTLTWASSEIALAVLKWWFHRGRPPEGALVETVGYSFPSGHAVAAAATAVALVFAFLPAGPTRRHWEWIAVGFAFLMAVSRVYLRAHWLSDVVAGVLLGTGIAIFWAAAITEYRDRWHARRGTSPHPAPSTATPDT